jgi:hypothetical protein
VGGFPCRGPEAPQRALGGLSKNCAAVVKVQVSLVVDRLAGEASRLHAMKLRHKTRGVCDRYNVRCDGEPRSVAMVWPQFWAPYFTQAVPLSRKVRGTSTHFVMR